MNEYNTLVQKYYKEILYYCCMRLNGNKHDSEDCTQEVFLTLYKKLHTLRLDDNIRAWLYETAKREVDNHLKKAKKHHVILDDIAEIEDTSRFDEMSGSILDKLGHEERQLIEMYYSGQDREKIAKSMNMTINSLRLRIHRIRKKLLEESDKN